MYLKYLKQLVEAISSQETSKVKLLDCNHIEKWANLLPLVVVARWRIQLNLDLSKIPK